MAVEICTVWSITWPKNCVEKYSELDEETSPFCLGWNPYNKTTCSGITYESTIITANAWKYTNAKDIWGFSILGEYNSYSGGGYILEFTKNREQAVAMLNELMKYYWIDPTIQNTSQCIEREGSPLGMNVKYFSIIS